MKRLILYYRLLSIIIVQFLFLLCYSQPPTPESNELADTASINTMSKHIRKIIKTDSKEALSLSRKVVRASEWLKYSRGMMDGYYSLAYILKRSGELDSAKKFYKKCIILAEKDKDLEISSSVYLNLANIYNSQSDYDSAVLFDGYARERSIKESDTTIFIIASNNLAVTYRYLGMWDSSLFVLKENEKIIRLKKDTVRLGTCLHLQAMIMQGQGNVKAALEYYYKALDILKPTNRLAPVYLVQVDLASLYLEMGEFRKTIDLLTSIREGHEHEVQGQMSLNNTLGKAYQGIHNFDSAFFYYQKSLDECLALKQPGKAAMAYRFLGNLLNQQGKYTEAVSYLQKGLEVCDRKEMKQEYAITCNSLGTSFLNLQKIPQAEKYFSTAMMIGHELTDIAILKDAADGLQQVNVLNGNYKEAYKYMSQYKLYSDSLLNAENIRMITTKDLEYGFNNERASMMQQQAEERLLHQESLKRQKLIRNTTILVCVLLILISVITYRSYIGKKKANDEKAALMKEIHHRVKNNLQIISSLLNIQTEYLKDLSIIGAVKESQSRVKAMALIHQLLYQEENLTHIDIEMYLKQLVTTLTGIFETPDVKVTTEIFSEKILLDIDTSIPLGLIVTELVSNAFKYAFNDSKQGHIKIAMHRKERKLYELTVCDNGKGLPENFDIDNTNSMGLKLVNILSDQINAKFSFQSREGTSFKLIFGEN